MRLHRNLVFAVIDGLDLIFNRGQYADKVVESLLKRDKRWGSRDRGFIAETVYEIVRFKRLYTKIAEVKTPFSREDLFRVFTVWATLRGIVLPDWRQFEGTPIRRIKGRYDELRKVRKLRESIPDWLDDLGVKSLGENRWTQELKALNEPAKVVLRTNTLKTSKKELKNTLEQEGIMVHPLEKFPEALVLEKRANVFKTDAFRKGLFEVQDASSQRVAPLLSPKPGQRIIDACAGAGGKTLHLASLMQNKGQIIALDIYENKLKQLKKRARRNGVHNIDIRLIHSSKVIKKLHGSADGVLIDAPCTGLGVLRRNPDAKWKLQPEFLSKIIQTQQTILRDYSKLVKPGGQLVYATCSILTEENSAQIKAFLASEEGKEFKIVSEETILPSVSGFDGFYLALLQRK